MANINGKPKPDKPTVAKMKVLRDLGNSDRQIARKLKCSNHTVAKYLKRQDLLQDPEVIKLVELIKKTEIADLYVIGEKARARIHELLDNGKVRPIEAVAIQDRSFQQRRLLESQPTNIGVLAYADLVALRNQKLKELEQLEAQEDRGKETGIEERSESPTEKG